MKATILIPVYNDWESLMYLENEIKLQFEYPGNEIQIDFLIINDFSLEQNPGLPGHFPIEVIHLRRNVGHQRAIAIGLNYAYHYLESDYYIVMDSDGEDAPADLIRLIKTASQTGNIVFAKRIKRHESLLFRSCYILYKFLFFLSTGKSINFGNYSIIPQKWLKNLILLEDIWNHYSGAIIKSKIPFSTIPTIRGKRYFGQSKMNFSNLVIHGFSSLSIYLDTILTRITLLTLFILGVNFLLGLFVFYRKFVTGLASPGWFTSAIFGLIGISVIFLFFSFITGLLVLNRRNQWPIPNNEKDFESLITATNENNRKAVTAYKN